MDFEISNFQTNGYIINKSTFKKMKIMMIYKTKSILNSLVVYNNNKTNLTGKVFHLENMSNFSNYNLNKLILEKEVNLALETKLQIELINKSRKENGEEYDVNLNQLNDELLLQLNSLNE